MRDETMLRRTGKMSEVWLLMAILAISANCQIAEAYIWSVESVDVTGTEMPSLAMGPDGNPMVAYFSAATSDLILARYDGLTWQKETVENSGFVGYKPSLAIGNDGQPRLSYHSSSGLKFARYDGTIWHTEFIDAGSNPAGISLALDSSDNPRIAYYDSNIRDLQYASWNGASWDIDVVDDEGADAGAACSLAIDSQGQPHISYYFHDSRDLRYATSDGMNWSIETVDAYGWSGMHSSIAVDSQDRPHIAYNEGINWDLRYAAFNGSTWDIELVDGQSKQIGYEESLVLDANDLPRIAYQCADTTNLEFASYDGVSWTLAVIEDMSTMGKYVSLAVDDSGGYHVSYMQYYGGVNDLRYAYAIPEPATLGLLMVSGLLILQRRSRRI